MVFVREGTLEVTIVGRGKSDKLRFRFRCVRCVKRGHGWKNIGTTQAHYFSGCARLGRPRLTAHARSWPFPRRAFPVHDNRRAILSQSSREIPFRSSTTFPFTKRPLRMSLLLPFRRAPVMSTKPKFRSPAGARRSRRRRPDRSHPQFFAIKISRAGSHVERAITSSTDIPSRQELAAVDVLACPSFRQVHAADVQVRLRIESGIKFTRLHQKAPRLAR